MVPSLVRSPLKDSEPPAGTSIDCPALSGPPCTVIEVASKEALPPPLRTRVEGASGVPELDPPSCTKVPLRKVPLLTIEPPAALVNVTLS